MMKKWAAILAAKTKTLNTTLTDINCHVRMRCALYFPYALDIIICTWLRQC